jgi:hypothetical protein
LENINFCQVKIIDILACATEAVSNCPSIKHKRTSGVLQIPPRNWVIAVCIGDHIIHQGKNKPPF